MNNQEILPEPIPHGPEINSSDAESDGVYSENEKAKTVELDAANMSNPGAAALGGTQMAAAQSQVGSTNYSSVYDDSQQGNDTNAATAQLSADDLDLIEKEWVKKAKEIVEATQNDPHIQSEELSKVKADYIKKRYGKDIKVKESS